MNNLKQLKQLLLGLTLLLTACGGGGGSAPPAVTYSGVTTQATVTAGNAKALSIDAYQGGQIGSSMSVMGVVAESSVQAPADSARLQRLGITLVASVRQVLAAPAVAGAPAPVGASAEATIPGYSGSIHYAVSYNEGSGAFSGTVTFNSYQGVVNGEILSGSMSFSGVIDQATGGFTSLTMTVTSLVVNEGGRTVTAYGSITLSLGGTTESIAMSLVLTDSTSGRTYWVKDFTFTVSALGSETLTGTYYDPIHGYVTITTLTPLTVASTDAWPTAGQLLFTGANGSKARLTFTLTGYTVEIYSTGSGTWTVVP